MPPITPPATTPALEEEALLLEELSALVSPLLEVEVESAADEAVDEPLEPDPDESAVLVEDGFESVAEVGLTAADWVPVGLSVDVVVAEDDTELVLGLAL